MGSPYSEAGRRFAEGPVKQVEIKEGFWLAETTVTQQQWEKVMGSTARDQIKLAGSPAVSRNLGLRLPIGYVNWRDAQEYCARLTKREHMAGRLDDNWVFDLPTEAEWEYACRAGTSGPFYAGSLEDIAWFQDNTKSRNVFGALRGFDLRAVGTRTANQWGLFDMLGNIQQWCADDYRDNPEHTSVGLGPVIKVIRGSSCGSVAADCRSALRQGTAVSLRDATIGFRIKLAPSQRAKPIPAAQSGLDALQMKPSAEHDRPAGGCLVIGRGVNIYEAIDRETRKLLSDLPIDVALRLNERLGQRGRESSLVVLTGKEYSNRLGNQGDRNAQSFVEVEQRFANEVARCRAVARRQGFQWLVLVQVENILTRGYSGTFVLSEASFSLSLAKIDETGQTGKVWTESVGSSKWDGNMRSVDDFVDRVANSISDHILFQ